MNQSGAEIVIGKYHIQGTNHQELLGIKKEIFGESIYYVDIDKPNPVIIDAGAHVGLATLYFKQIWPQAQITCIEPHPAARQYLKENVWQNRLENIAVIEAALSDQAGERTFYFDQTEAQWLSAAGFTEGAWNHQQQSQSITVPTITLDSIINGPVDYLKMDIEGAEVQVLTACRHLRHIHQLVVELHPESPHKASPLVKFLEKHSYTVSVTKTHYGLSRLHALRR